MTNMVLPLNQPTVDMGNNLSSITGSISNPTSDLGSLSVGQQITVQINPQSLAQISTNMLLDMDISLPDISGNVQNINTPVELSRQLKLPSYPVDMQIRITASTPQKIEFRIINIDGKPTSLFIPKTADTSINPPTALSVPSAISEASRVSQHPLLPLKTQPLLEQIFTELSVSASQTTELVQSLPNYQIKMEISRLQGTPTEQAHILEQADNEVMSSNSGSIQASLSVAPQPPVSTNIVPQLPRDVVDTLISILKDTLSIPQPDNFAINKPQPDQNYPQVPQNISNFSQPVTSSHPLTSIQPNIVVFENKILPQLEQTLQTLVGREFPALVIDKGELKILQTPLGEVVPEFPLKLESGEQLLLKISELIIPHNTKKDNTIHGPLSNSIIEILKPLQEQILPADFVKLVAKIPADNNKMLSNIISFLKATETEDISDWLGKELTDIIRLSGTKGQNSLNQLENLLIGRKEENSLWRIIEIPFFDADNLNKIQIAIRKYHKKDSANRHHTTKSEASRFVVDTTFSALGAFQFDGFSITKDKRFDLIIRTEKDIADDFCSHIMQLFRSSLSAVGYAGNIHINVKEKFIKLCEDEPENTILQHGLYI